MSTGDLEKRFTVPNKIFLRLLLLFFKVLLLFNLACGAIIFVADFTENLRKYIDYNNFSFATVFIISLCKQPFFLMEASPFIVLFSSFYTIRSIVLQRELDIYRSSGISIWKFLTPFLLVVFLWGSMLTFGMSYLSSKFLTQKDTLEQALVDNTIVNENVIWMIDKQNASYQHFIMLQEMKKKGNLVSLVNPNVFEVRNDSLKKMWIAQTGLIRGNELILYKVIEYDRNKIYAQEAEEYKIILGNKNNDLNSLSLEPSRFSIYDFYSFIKNLDELNLDSKPYKSAFYNILTLPLIFMAMVIISTIFALSDLRRGKNLYAIFMTLSIGFILYFVLNFVNALGVAGVFPPLLAHLLSKSIALLIAVQFLLHKEGL